MESVNEITNVCEKTVEIFRGIFIIEPLYILRTKFHGQWIGANATDGLE